LVLQKEFPHLKTRQEGAMPICLLQNHYNLKFENMKREKRIFHILLLTLFSFLSLQAQVTVGSDNPPAKAALLEVKTQEPNADNVTTDKGGLLLPRVQLQMLNSLLPFLPDSELTAQGQKHAGLMVYNVKPVTAQNIEKGVYVWDGIKWVRSESGATATVDADNGLTWTGSKVQLGGNLNKNTTVDQSSWDMLFSTGSSGRFSVNSNGMVVYRNNVGIGTSSPSYQLHVSGDSYLTGNMGIGTTPHTSYRVNVDGNSRLYGNVGINANPSSTYTLNVAGTSYISYSSYVMGNLGVGTISPGQKLHVQGNSYMSGVAKIGSSDTSITNTSAQMELADNNKGLLLNRVALTSPSVRAPVSNATAGMMVYNTTPNASLTPGVYYWNGVNWIRMVTEVPSSELNMRDLQKETATLVGNQFGTGGSLLDFGSIIIPEDGSYAFNFRFYGTIGALTQTITWCFYYLSAWLDNETTPVDIAEINIYVGNLNKPSTYSIALGVKAKAGQKVTFKMSHGNSTPNNPWTLKSSPGGSNANRTSMIWWKL